MRFECKIIPKTLQIRFEDNSTSYRGEGICVDDNDFFNYEQLIGPFGNYIRENNIDVTIKKSNISQFQEEMKRYFDILMDYPDTCKEFIDSTKENDFCWGTLKCWGFESFKSGPKSIGLELHVNQDSDEIKLFDKAIFDIYSSSKRVEREERFMVFNGECWGFTHPEYRSDKNMDGFLKDRIPIFLKDTVFEIY